MTVARSASATARAASASAARAYAAATNSPISSAAASASARNWSASAVLLSGRGPRLGSGGPLLSGGMHRLHLDGGRVGHRRDSVAQPVRDPGHPVSLGAQRAQFRAGHPGHGHRLLGVAALVAVLASAMARRRRSRQPSPRCARVPSLAPIVLL